MICDERRERPDEKRSIKGIRAGEYRRRRPNDFTLVLRGKRQLQDFNSRINLGPRTKYIPDSASEEFYSGIQSCEFRVLVLTHCNDVGSHRIVFSNS